MNTLHLVTPPSVNPTEENIGSCRVQVTPRYIKWLLARRKAFERLRKEELSLYCIEYYYPPAEFGDYTSALYSEPGQWYVEPTKPPAFTANRYVDCITLKAVKTGVLFTCLSKYDTDKGEIQTPEISWDILEDLNAGRHVLKEVEL